MDRRSLTYNPSVTCTNPLTDSVAALDSTPLTTSKHMIRFQSTPKTLTMLIKVAPQPSTPLPVKDISSPEYTPRSERRVPFKLH
ncbi:hypothetical protein J6590_094381 [Homalodisca vitripennis]|nr:hypothetical protein J6590_094381 [Homalodisca vitripennis]